MTTRRAYELVYDREVMQHLKVVEKKHYSLIERTIEEQLSYEPDVEAKNRKPLLRPTTIGADWELRFGPDNRFRVFYRIHRANWEVHILAIGIKKGNRLFIGGRRFEL